MGQVVSLFGDWFNLIASASLVATLTESGFAVGGLFVVRMLAPFLASPFAGVVADRYNRKRILVWTDIIRGVTVLGFLLVRDASLVWLLYTLTALQLAVSGFFFTARTAILPDIVETSALGTANAITSTTWSTMLTLGAATGGLVAGILGVYVAFIIDATTFFVATAFISQIRFVETRRRQSADRTIGSILAEYIEGLGVLRQRIDLFFIALHKPMLMLFFGSTFQVIQVALAQEFFDFGQQGSLGVGIVFAMIGIGSGVGPLVARRVTGDDEGRLRLAIVAGYLLGAIGLVVTGTLTDRITVLSGILLVGLGNGLLWVFSTQLLLQLIPAAVRGRVLSTEFALSTLASAAGAAAAGVALDHMFDIPFLLYWMAALSLFPACFWYAWTVVLQSKSD